MPEQTQPSSHSQPWTRRRFLQIAFSGTAGVLLAACGRKSPTPTPTPTRTPRPSATPSATLRPSATATLPASPTPTGPATATATATASATATEGPPPEPTPTPSATPFPPGPPSKLGLFVGYNNSQLFDLLRTGNVALVKTLEYDRNFVAEIKQVSPHTLVVARYTPLPQLNLDTLNPQQTAREFVDLLLPIATDPLRQANIDAWESYNEPNPANLDQMARLADLEAERTRLLAASGIRSCIGNFSTGQPALELWPAFYPALQAAKEHNGYLGLHEYSAPTLWFGSGPHQLDPNHNAGDEGWLTLRYRKVYRNFLQPAGLDIPLLITETGIDGQVGGRPGPKGLGWRDFITYWWEQGNITTIAEGFYVEQLAWYDSELVKDDYVLGASIYTLAGPSGWETFEIQGLAANILRDYLAVHPPR